MQNLLLASTMFVFFKLLTTLISSQTVYASERPTLVLGQGEQRLLTIPGLVRYSLGSSIVQIARLPQGIQSKDCLLLRALKPGLCDFWVWTQEGQVEQRLIRVEKLKKQDLDPALERALAHLEETEVIFSGREVVLQGETKSVHEATRIAGLKRNFPKSIQDRTYPSSGLLTHAKNALDSWLQSSPLAGQLRLEVREQEIWIRGGLQKPSDLQSVLKKIDSLYPLTQTEISSLPDGAVTVYFRVFLIELKRKQFHRLGLSWPDRIESSLQINKGGLLDFSQIDLQLHQLEGSGDVHILSNPELVVRAPGEAELFAGGQLPIQVQSRFFSDVRWKNYGLTLKLNVTHTSGRFVRLEIFTEVSHLESGASSGGLPGLQANRMKTQVDATFGVPLFLSGLLQTGSRQDTKGLPLLQNIPILRKLFGSEDYLNERSELIAILYPEASPPKRPEKWIPDHLPKGILPLARDWIEPNDLGLIRNAKDYPWNILDQDD